jgi:ribose transport system permease protein
MADDLTSEMRDAAKLSEASPARAIQGTRRLKAQAAIGEATKKYGLLIAWIVLILVFGILRPALFLTPANVSNILGSQSVLLILALGVLAPFAAGEYDLSIAGVMSVSVVLVGYLNVLHHWPVGAAVAAALLAGVLVGCVNVLLILVVGIESIVVTLGMGTLLAGLAFGINIQTTGGISDSLVQLVRHQVIGLPLAFFYVLALTTFAWYVLSYTPLGRYLYFVGAGREVARLSGLRVNAIRGGSLMASAFVSALAGVVLAGWLGASDPNVAASYLLPAFAAVFLGATAFTPGRFNAWGTFVAVYFLVTGVTGLEILGLVGWVEQVFYGASLILAVALSHFAGTGR